MFVVPNRKYSYLVTTRKLFEVCEILLQKLTKMPKVKAEKKSRQHGNIQKQGNKLIISCIYSYSCLFLTTSRVIAQHATVNSAVLQTRSGFARS